MQKQEEKYINLKINITGAIKYGESYRIYTWYSLWPV
jgi:hypothetical protein